MTRYTFAKERVLLVVLLLIFALWALSPAVLGPSSKLHPISLLMRDAERTYLARLAARPTTLEQAYATYSRKHKRPPPKGYDHWFLAARNLQACQIDGFDDLYESLRVWWALSPGEIRARQEQMQSVNGMGRVRVRHGRVVARAELEKRAEAGADTDARRAFQEMLEAISQQFGIHLPDVDMFINGYDEPRISLPFELRDSLEKLAARKRVRTPVNETFMLRSFGGTPYTLTKFDHACVTGTCPTAFEQLRKACPPYSAARRHRIVDDPGKDPIVSHKYTKAFTTAVGHFLTSPRVEQDTWCDQPDLASLHATYIHPLSFTYSDQLFPVFGNSRVGGYHDILIPSWWYWNDASPYVAHDDRLWEEKVDKVFWRGTNTGGYSIELNWRGWLRSRVVSKTNRPTDWPHTEDVLLTNYEDATIEVKLPAAALNAALTDIAFAAPDQGHPASLNTQRTEPSFRYTGMVPFADNYKSKMVLDVDGTAYSGRFRTLMKSRGAVLKAHAFREAIEDSLVPWYHYIPLGVRLTELYSILGYFFGGVGVVEQSQRMGLMGLVGRSKTMAAERGFARDDELHKIAQRGSEWAHRCARKEDLMLHAWLIALEWGRLTSDQRDSANLIL